MLSQFRGSDSICVLRTIFYGVLRIEATRLVYYEAGGEYDEVIMRVVYNVLKCVTPTQLHTYTQKCGEENTSDGAAAGQRRTW